MNIRKIKWMLLGITGLLAVMGLMFTLKCPIDCIFGENSGIFFFKKQLLWNVIGISACVGAALVPWRKWLKFAPWGMLAWFGLMVWAMMFSSPLHGSYRWVNFGSLSININVVLILVWALFTAWLCLKKQVKPWMIFALIGIALVAYGVLVFNNANRLSRIVRFFTGEGGGWYDGFVHHQMRGAFASANWFGDADRSLRCLPNAHADAMPSSAALIFGKWFTFVAMSLCAMLGYVLTLIWMSLKNPSKKMFVLFWGGTMVGGTLYTFCQCIGIVPAIGFSPVLIGYGGTIAVIFWCGLGILLSLLSEEEEYKKLSRKKTVVVGSVFCSLIVIILLGMEVQRGLGCKFYQMSVNTSRLGEFGSNAKRGEIYASDGTVLARSVKRYDVRIDPKIAREYKIAVNEDSLTNICPRLGLTPAELLDFCHIDKSRYVLVKSNIDESVAKWFRSDEGRRLSKGFIVETIQEREYPLGSNAVHVTGCVYRWPGKTTEGATGIEYTCNEVLAGHDGKRVRDAGRSEQLALAKPIHGGSVTTTIVPSIQNLLADALMKAVATNNAESAWGIVMNATNGEIAAIASLPTYHPAKSRDIKSGPCYFSNNAAGMIFEPGALMKPLTYAMALDKGLITLDTEIDHGNGVWEYSGKHFRDIHTTTGVMSVAKAFIKRTNIAPCKIGLMMWKDGDLENISHWGFGQKVGNDTVYGEERGLVRDSNKYDKVSLACLGMGYGIAVTGLQIANAYAVLANGGKTVTPHLVSKIVSTNGVASIYEPKEPPKQVVSDKTSKTIALLMKEALNSVGKNNSYDLEDLDLAGAISSMQIPVKGSYSKTDFNVTAAGFFPVANPKWVLVIGFTKPHPQFLPNKVSLPVFVDIARKITSDSSK